MSDPDLAARGCSAEAQGADGIAIVRGHHHRGLWAWTGTRFTFTPGGYSAPIIATAAEALRYTRNVVCPGK